MVAAQIVVIYLCLSAAREVLPGRRFRVYVEKDAETGLFAARCLEMSVFSHCRTEKEALKNVRATISLHLDELEKETKGKSW
jgi:predicted RNase H-like HicB family nuclease